GYENTGERNMKDAGPAGYIWDRSTIKAAMLMGIGLIFAIFISISSYENHLNSLKRIAFEKTASEILGTKVTIGNLYIRLNRNEVIMTDVKIANLPGYKKIPQAMTIQYIY